MVVVGDVVSVIAVAEELVLKAVHLPVPEAVMVAVEFWQTVLSTPALGLAVTTTLIVS